MTKMILKTRKIGDFIGIILPKKLGVTQNEQLPDEVHNGHLYIDLKKGMAKKRGQMINNSFNDLDKSLNEKQMKRLFGKEDW